MSTRAAAAVLLVLLAALLLLAAAGSSSSSPRCFIPSIFDHQSSILRQRSPNDNHPGPPERHTRLFWACDRPLASCPPLVRRPLSWRQFRSLFGPLGGRLGASWGLFAASWRPCGALLGRLGRLWGSLGLSRAPLGLSWGLLRPCWAALGAALGPSQAVLEAS